MDDIKVNQNPKLGSMDRPNSYIGRSLPRENAKKHLDAENAKRCIFKVSVCSR